MPVPSLITDLSTTAASNSPAGAESARGTIDDYLRAHASFIAQNRAGTSATTYTYSGTGARIQGDFSNATVGNRTFLQDKTTNNASSVGVIPNGTGAEASVAAFGASDPSNSTYLTIASGSAYTKLESGKTGSASYAPLSFSVAGAEAARFATNGQFLVGTTNGSSTAGSGIKMTPDAAAPWVATVGSDTTGANASYYLYSSTPAAYRFYVTYSGTVHAVSTTITAISDARLKENIRDLDAGLTEIMALQPRRFDWKPGKGKDKKDDWGWIAQEFEQTFPEMIQTWKDPAPEGEEPYKAVNADLIPVLVKAMQEQQALIVSLEARVAALEAA